MMNGSSLGQGGHTLFSLDTQSGIADVLAAIRASAIETAHKNELRDLVFLYTNGGKDQTVRLSLEQKIAAFNLTPVPRKAPTAKPLPPPPMIGTFRTAPSFTVPTFTPEPKKEPVFTEAPVWKPAPVVEEVVVPVAPVPTPAPVAAPQAVPLKEVEVQSIPVVSQTMPAPDQQQYLERIREIKGLVNEKVGNPVNLVDIDNEVGREYMGALLDAMKKLNTGSSAASAMQRLEESYKMVEQTLQKHAAASTPAPFTQPEPVFQPAPEPAPVAAPLPEPMMPQVSKEPFVPPMPLSMSVEPAPAVRSQQPLSQFETMQAEVPRAPIVSQFSSLADLAEKPHTPYDLPISKESKQSIAADILFSAEVDDGLDQLLAEWSIFKKSGLFGTGPKGKEHPLFKKMAPLQIPLLLAGRFDGATQEIKQSVTDYMNGWRYEQGLIYEKGETFEHYLRRVIRHILDLQKK
jgi:hypothetical protein